MGYNININGLIEGVSKESFDLIKEDLEIVFTEVSWKNNTIEVNSCGKYCDEVLHPVYNKIAFCIDGDGGGQLDIEGDECGDFSSIFFVPRQWKQVWLEITYPKNPFIKKSTNITYSTTAYIHVDPSMFEEISSEFDGWANGSESVCISKDDLENRLATRDIENDGVIHYLQTVEDELTGEVGDIVFHT